MRFRAEDLRPHGGNRAGRCTIPDWCGCAREYLPVLGGDGWWDLIPIWDPDQTATPLRRWEPAVPYWASD